MPDPTSAEQLAADQLSAEQLSAEQACAVPAGAGSSSSPMAIGEVLVALRSDFPDITVSKIRFLDGAGLVSPQRSGSGYRRFSAADLLRLRQVLVLQRDHYLPLKVIRAHIAAGSLDRALVEVAHPQAQTSARLSQDTPTDTSPEAPAAADEGSGGLTPVPDGAPGRGRGPLRRRTVTAAPAAAPPTLAHPPAAPHGPALQHGAALQHGPALQYGPAAPHGSAAGRSPAGVGAANPGPRAFAGHPRRLRVEDLLRLSGLPIETLTELETAGLLRSRNGWYHAEDLAVAVAAAQLAVHGIGPRHLRSLRNGADRELGLLEQSLVPLLRRARPDARTRAEDTARTLRELYAQVHTALVTAGLRDLGIDPR